MKTTISMKADEFETDAKRMIVMTTEEQAMILQAVESLEAQAATLKAMLRSMGFDHYTFATDNPRTVARLNLTMKQQDDQS
jgi:hypothetical protein